MINSFSGSPRDALVLKYPTSEATGSLKVVAVDKANLTLTLEMKKGGYIVFDLNHAFLLVKVVPPLF